MKSVQVKIFLTQNVAPIKGVSRGRDTITATIVITVLAEIEDYSELEVTNRPLPADMLEVNNKTEYELAIEECMDDFVACLSTLGEFNKNKKICAENQYSKRKVFENACDMMYSTCKTDKESWHFLKDDDGHCSF